MKLRGPFLSGPSQPLCSDHSMELRSTNIRLKTLEKYELNEQFSYSQDAKDARELAEKGGCLMDNFLFISISVFAFGDKL